VSSDPAPPVFAEWFSLGFRKQANGLAMMYGAPLFLVGGALREHRPYDVDIRIPLQEHDIDRLFGTDNDMPKDAAGEADIYDHSVRDWRWMREELKQSRRLSRQWSERFDFQFQHAERFWRCDMPRIRLDSVPRWTFLAGLCDA
jgi:hypothetical protein